MEEKCLVYYSPFFNEVFVVSDSVLYDDCYVWEKEHCTGYYYYDSLEKDIKEGHIVLIGEL